MTGLILAAWLVAVKWPLTLIMDGLFFRSLRRRAGNGFDAWAAAAAAQGTAAIAAAIKERVTYLADPLRGVFDYVAAPAVTWARRYGDCDDFAYLAAELLRRAGVESWLASYLCWNVKDSHTLCLFRDGARFGFLDQGEIKNDFATLVAAARAGRPSTKVAGQYVRRYGRGADLVGRWLVRNGARPSLGATGVGK